MADFSEAFKNEVARLAKKESRQIESELREALAAIKKTMQEHKQRLAKVEAVISKIYLKTVEKPDSVERQSASDGGAIKTARVTPEAILKMRGTLGLGRRKMALLLDVHQNTIVSWESGKTAPRDQAKSRLLELKSMGKREVAKRLEEALGGSVEAPATKRKMSRRKSKDGQ